MRLVLRFERIVSGSYWSRLGLGSRRMLMGNAGLLECMPRAKMVVGARPRLDSYGCSSGAFDY